MVALVQCPSCHKVGASETEIRSQCGAMLTCAKRVVPIDPAKDIVVSCETCARKVAVSAADVMSGKEPNFGKLCQRSKDSCQAVVLPVKAVRGKAQEG